MQPTITDRVLKAAEANKPRFSTMDILFYLNQQHPMVDLRQVQHALEHLAKQGHFIKLCAGRFAWK